MNERAAKDAIKKIAKREGKSESEIREEMKKAILCGFLNNETRCKWDRLFGVGGCQARRNLLGFYHWRLQKDRIRNKGILVQMEQFYHLMW